MGKLADIFRKAVERLQAEKKISQREIARSLKVKPPVVSKLIDRANPRLDSLEAIAGALGVEPWELLRPAEFGRNSGGQPHDDERGRPPRQITGEDAGAKDDSLGRFIARKAGSARAADQHETQDAEIKQPNSDHTYLSPENLKALVREAVEAALRAQAPPTPRAAEPAPALGILKGLPADSRARMLEMINYEREAHGLPPIQADPGESTG